DTSWGIILSGGKTKIISWGRYLIPGSLEQTHQDQVPINRDRGSIMTPLTLSLQARWNRVLRDF
ncbi:hypothetical protein, partial [Endozoicomonas sp. SESOKO3]|uniref:hypothetical protein n=1 Tax=Endozoicomonas sp. SESOKO3 TaxID=2828744 RepID=UPI00214865F4